MINPETDGAMPVDCQLQMTGDKMQISYGGNRGWIIQVSTNDLLEEMRNFDSKWGGRDKNGI